MVDDDRGGLKSGLKRRHVTMISLGGVIGAGLFVGSGAVINQTGPAAVLSYLAAGLLVVLVMRMLGEMAVANPSTGSFADYAGLALGGWARFLVGGCSRQGCGRRCRPRWHARRRPILHS